MMVAYMRVVTEKTDDGWWRVKIVETNWPAVGVGWLLGTSNDSIFHRATDPCVTDFASRREAREALKRYAGRMFGVKITGGLH
jgi:hypothetical protein